MNQQANGEVCTFAHLNYIEGLWKVLKFCVKHVYNTVPENGREVDYLMESVFRPTLHHYLSKKGKTR